VTACDQVRGDLAAHIYGDLETEADRALAEHLAGCSACREELRGLQRVAQRLRSEALEAIFPREAEVDWQAFARSTVQRATGYRTRARKDRAQPGLASWWWQVLSAPGWAGAAAGLLLLAGAAAGTYGVLSLRPAEQPAVAAAAALPRAETLIPGAMLANLEATTARSGTERYLSESRALLLSLLGAPIHCEKDTLDIKDERKKSLELIRRQRLIADDLESLPLARAQDVCRDLERLFVEIASLSDCARAEQIRELRDLVESRRLLLRLDLVADEMKRATARDI